MLKTITPDIKNIIKTVCPFAIFESLEKLGKEILTIRTNQSFDTATKSDASPVTKADFLVHQIFTQIFNEQTPDIPLLSEENQDSHNTVQKSEVYWLLDPLDGTKEYINGYDDFGIALAKIEHGKATFGLIYAPAKDELYFGINGCSLKTAYKYTNHSWQKINPNTNTKIKKIVVSRSHLDEITESIINKYDNPEIIKMGSCLKFCYVADGSIDAYIKANDFYIWDVASGHAILEASGGVLKNITKKDVFYNQGLKVEGIFAINNPNLS